MKSLIGIYSRPSDDHLERVVTELQRRKLPWVRFDTADFPLALQVAARISENERSWRGDFILQNTPYHLEEFRSIWYRRPTKIFCFPKSMSETGYEYAKAEAQRGFPGLLHSLPIMWVSHPDAIRAAEWKPKQLTSAQRLGFTIPKTLITNNPQAALQFFEECEGEMIYKPLNQGVPRPKRGETWQGAIYTTKVTRAALEKHLPSIALTAHLFQQYIPKAFELRINVIGTQVFAAEIHSQQSERTRIDFRMSYVDLTYQIHQLPAQIEAACLALTRQFHLQFAAMDLVVTPQQEYIFLELNASGQWGWIEAKTGLPLTAALVDLLASGNLEEV